MLKSWLGRVASAVRPARSRVIGDEVFAEDDPTFEHHQNVTYAPQTQPALTNDMGWGLFDRTGLAIAASRYRRGPGPSRMGGAERARPGFETLPAAEPPSVFYGGQFGVHFGHFLLSGLSRLWPLVARELPPGAKILYHGSHSPESLFRLPYMAEVFGALGLTAADFILPNEPMRFREVIVPGPSHEEMHGSHRAHVRLGSRIGRSLLGPVPPARGTPPLYLSRQRLPAGTNRIANEEALASALAQSGVAIAYPETLSVADQVRLFERHPIVVSLVGSALHACLLSSRANDVIGISMHPVIHSDYSLVDRLKGNRAAYLFPAYRERVDEADRAFHRVAAFRHPRRLIDEVLRTIDRAQRRP